MNQNSVFDELDGLRRNSNMPKGSIESFHGRFGDGELDHNGFTTEPIYGPALDGRILEVRLSAGAASPTQIRAEFEQRRDLLRNIMDRLEAAPEPDIYLQMTVSYGLHALNNDSICACDRTDINPSTPSPIKLAINLLTTGELTRLNP